MHDLKVFDLVVRVLDFCAQTWGYVYAKNRPRN